MKLVISRNNTVLNLKVSESSTKLTLNVVETTTNLVLRIGEGIKGDRGVKGDPGASVAASIVATEAINQFDVVTGSGKRATSDNITYRNKIVGVAINSIANGFSGDVQTGGTITNPAWSFVSGDRIYLNGYILSTTPPLTGFSIQVGIATATDTINIEIQISILL